MTTTPNPAPSDHSNPPRREAPFASLAAIAALIAGLGMASGYLIHKPAPAVANGLYLLAMTAGGIPALPGAWKALKRGRLDVNVLMLVAAIGAAAIGNPGEGATLLFLFALSEALEAFAMGRTRDAIHRLVGMRPKQVRRDDGTLVPVEDVKQGETFVVHPAEAFPLDGDILTGTSSVDQSVMTGEAEPVSRGPGDRVVSGTLNLDGILAVRATSTARDSSLERVIALVAAAQEEKSLASSERLAERIGRYYAPLVLVGSLGWFLILGAMGVPTSQAAYRALTLLVAASPCALVLSSPAAILSALASAGRRGLLVRSGSVLESLARVDTVTLDKTGTLTTGKPSVVSVWDSAGSEDALLALAASAERTVPHPLAQALVREAARRNLSLPTVEEVQTLPGKGVTARLEGQTLVVGRPEWLQEQGTLPELDERVRQARSEGRSVVVVQVGADRSGLIALEDTLRPDAEETLTRLERECHVTERILLTGDHAQAGAALQKRLPGITSVRADLHPSDKADVIRSLSESGRTVAMIGDGVNDAPALASAAVGITLGGIGSDVALDSADVVIMEDRLSAVPEAISLARRARTVALQNVVVSLLGVGLLVLAVFLRGVPLPLAVIFHEGTTVLVVLNGLRLLR